MARQIRKRYVVTIQGMGQTQQVVIISTNLEGMYREVHRLYGHLLIDKRGRDTGTISFQETNLI